MVARLIVYLIRFASRMHTYLDGRTLFWMFILFGSYLLSAQFSLHLYAVGPGTPVLIWPAAGIALGGLLIGGIRLWPAVALAAFVHQLLYGFPVFVALAFAFGSTLQPVVGAWLIRRTNFRTLFSRVPGTLAFVAVALFVTTIVPTVGVLTLTVAGWPLENGFSGIWLPWWISYVLSVLIITPLMVRWMPRMKVHRARIEWFEALLALTTLIIVDVLLFWTQYREIGNIPLVYLILGPLLWIALRIGPRFMTLALFLNAAIALGGTIYFASPESLGFELFQTEIFIIMISFIFLILVSVAEERKDTANDLRKHVHQLEDALEQIQKDADAKGRFIATLAHELRNPLAPLITSLELMKLEGANRATSEIADGMTQHINTMRRLLDDLLDISRISREKLTLQKESVDLHGIVNRSVRMVDPIIRDNDHTLTLSLPDETVLFEADPVRLEQILVNLLNNAAKYTPRGGSITLSATVEGNMLVIRVIDTGIGIPPELLDQIFEPFHQIEQKGHRVSGLGIGLSLAQNLVRMHNGTIDAASEGPGKGSEFLVRLPLSNLMNPQSEQQKPTWADGSSVEQFRILVVDDNRAAADALTKLLTLRGHTVETAYTGTEAIEKAPVFLPNVVLLDIGLPDMEGYDVAEALRKQPDFDAALIALTGYGQESDIRKATKAGFDFHLTKPAGLADIEAILEKLV